jgi:chromosomal replication initiation ATPase DnaA
MTAAEIIRETAQAFDLSVTQLKSRSMSPPLVRARIDAAQRLAVELGMTGGEIARFLNRTDWTCRYYVNRAMRERHKTRVRAYMRVRG